LAGQFQERVVKRIFGKAVVVGALAIGLTAPAAAQYRNKLSNEPANCRAGSGPAVNVRISGITPSHGILRVQLYRGAGDWLQKGRWLSRIEIPAQGSSATVCMPVPAPGNYGIAVRHDVNGNGATDIRSDGGGMSNNPSINILNLGKPSYDKTAFNVGNAVKTITIQMRYF
jgi:uncharacterized protein (DUF2141 family)